MIFQSWFDVYLFWGLILLPIILIVVWFIDSVFLTPREAKTLKRATRKKKPVVPVAFDNGQCELKIVKELGDEGYIKTEDGWVGFLPRAQSNPGTANPITSSISILKDAKIPFLVGYAGKAILTTPNALAFVQYAKEKKIELPTSKDGTVEAKVFWPVNLRGIKELFPKSWNQAQVRASEVKSELTGILKGKKYFGQEGMKMFVLPGMIIIAIIVLFTFSVWFLRG